MDYPQSNRPNRTKGTRMNLSRRATFGAPLILLLSRCGATGSPNVQQAIADAQIVATGVQGAYGALKAFDPALTNSATDQQVQAIFARLPDALAQLKAATDPKDQADRMRAVEADVNGVINLAAGIVRVVPGVPPEVMLGFQAAVVLLPIIEAVANQLVPATVGGPTAPAVFANKTGMTAAQARGTLMTAGAKR